MISKFFFASRVLVQARMRQDAFSQVLFFTGLVGGYFDELECIFERNNVRIPLRFHNSDMHRFKRLVIVLLRILFHFCQEKVNIDQLESETFRHSPFKHTIDKVTIAVNGKPWSVWLAFQVVTFIVNYFDSFFI